MKYGIIRIKGHQYKVSEGDEILVDKVDAQKGVSAELLLLVDGETVTVGTPVLKGKTVVKVISEEKGEKINGFKYKAKSRYRKHYGHRSQLTKILVEKIAS